MPLMAEPKQELLTTAEAAARLGISSMTLRRWTNAGEIRTILLPSGHRRFEVAEIERKRREMGFDD